MAGPKRRIRAISCYHLLLSHSLVATADVNLQKQGDYTEHSFLIFNLQAANRTSGKG